MGEDWFSKGLWSPFEKGRPQKAQDFPHVLPPGVGSPKLRYPLGEPFVQVALHFFQQVRGAKPRQ
jgi:hypothetical protein